MDIGSERNPVRGLIQDFAAAITILDALTAAANRINPRVLAQLEAEPPKPFRELTVKARVDRETFERHAWSVISTNAANDPTFAGDPLGYLYDVGAGERRLSVYWPAEIDA